MGTTVVYATTAAIAVVEALALIFFFAIDKGYVRTLSDHAVLAGGLLGLGRSIALR